MYYGDDCGNYNLFDAIKANVTELHADACDDFLEEAVLLTTIYKDIDALKIKFDDLSNEVSDFRRRALKAEMELRHLKEKCEKEES